MAVTTGLDGFTDYTSEGTFKSVYVDSAQPNDNGDGLTPATAKKTVQAGYNLLTNGSGDRLLLKRGGSWTLSEIALTKSGASASNLLYIGDYGDTGQPRPILRGTGGSWASIFRLAGWGSAVTLRHVAFQNLSFISAGADYAFTFAFWNAAGSVCDDIRFEGCYMQDFTRGMRIQSDDSSASVHDAIPLTGFDIRRCVAYNCLISIYARGFFGPTTIQENCWIKCGTNQLEHGIYIDDSPFTSSEIIYKRNIALGDYLGGEGHKVRATSTTGIMEDNFACRYGVGISAGSGGDLHGGGTGHDPRYQLAANVMSNWSHECMGTQQSPNVIGDGIMLVWLDNPAGSLVRYNITTNGKSNQGRFGLLFFGGPFTNVVIRDNTFHNNNNGATIHYSNRSSGADYVGCSFIDNRMREPSSGTLVENNSSSGTPNFTRSGNSCWATGSSSNWFQIGNLAAWGTAATSATQGYDTSDLPVGETVATLRTYMVKAGLLSASATDDAAYSAFRTACLAQSRYNWLDPYVATPVNDHARKWAGYPLLGSGAPPSNVLPTADAGLDQNIIDTDNNGSQLVHLDGSGSSDSDGSISYYVWTTPTGLLPQSTSPYLDDTPILGSHNYSLSVIDNDGGVSASPDTVTVNVYPGQAVAVVPSTAETSQATMGVVPIPNATGYEYWGSTDSNNLVLIAGPTTATSYVQGGLTADVPFYWKVRAKAGSLAGAFSPTVEVIPIGGLTKIYPPVANAGPNQTATLNAGMPSVSVTLSGVLCTDPQGATPLSFVWKNESGVTIGTTQDINVSFTAHGTYQFFLTAINTLGRQATDYVIVTVAGSTPIYPLFSKLPSPTLVDQAISLFEF